MQVQLAFGDERAGTPSGAVANENDSMHRGDAAGLERSRDFATNMQIHVQLQDPTGGTFQELAPTAEGQLRLSVCKYGVYRLRVTGPTIEEAILEDLHPGRGDKLVTVVLPRKLTRQERSAKAMVSATRLSVPKKAQKQLEKGDAALRKAQLEDAKKFYRKALEIYPTFAEAENNLGVVLMQQGIKTEGKAAFESAVRMNDHYASAYINLAKIAVDEKRYSDGYTFSAQALRSEPLNPGALFLAAECAFFNKKYSETVAYTRTLHSMPHAQYALAHLLSAKSLETEDQPSAAISEYRTFLEEDPRDPNAQRARELLELLQSSQSAISQKAPQ